MVYIAVYFKNGHQLKSTLQVHSLLVFFELLLCFRTNAASDSWWEGRNLWGAMVNNYRNLSVKMNAMVATAEEKEE